MSDHDMRNCTLLFLLSFSRSLSLSLTHSHSLVFSLFVSETVSFLGSLFHTNREIYTTCFSIVHTCELLELEYAAMCVVEVYHGITLLSVGLNYCFEHVLK